jgi:hypothetical protein
MYVKVWMLTQMCHVAITSQCVFNTGILFTPCRELVVASMKDGD